VELSQGKMIGRIMAVKEFVVYPGIKEANHSEWLRGCG
jgi:hypothetical protein